MEAWISKRLGLVILLGAFGAVQALPPLFLPPGCAPARFAPAVWAERLLAEYDEEHAEFARRFRALPPTLAEAIGLNATLLAVTSAVAENGRALSALLNAAPEPVRALGDATASADCCVELGVSYASAADVLAHLARDWAVGSPAASASAALAQLLSRYLPARQSRVLVPGAGGCRLAVALAELGFTVEANDSSLPMLRAVQALLMLGSRTNRSPACHSPIPIRAAVLTDANVRWRAAQLHPAHVTACVDSPRQRARRALALGRLSLQLGSFADAALYAPSSTVDGTPSRGTLEPVLNATNSAEADEQPLQGRGGWDGVATLFALDALPMPPHRVVASVVAALKPGGIWLFAGPLAYHDPSVPPLAMDEIIAMLSQFNLTLLARKALTVQSYVPTEHPSGFRVVRHALLSCLCGAFRSFNALMPQACAQSPSLARGGYEAEVFIARLLDSR